MEQKTKVHAEENRHDLFITREFDLPVELLFRAYSEPEFLEKWMGTTVLFMENKPYGGWQFETRDVSGKVVFRARGAVHEFVPGRKIVRTFEMENAPFGVQLEVLQFEELTRETSRLTIHSIYESPDKRDGVLKLPFAYGIDMAHNRLEETMNLLK